MLQCTQAIGWGACDLARVRPRSGVKTFGGGLGGNLGLLPGHSVKSRFVPLGGLNCKVGLTVLFAVLTEHMGWSGLFVLRDAFSRIPMMSSDLWYRQSSLTVKCQ